MRMARVGGLEREAARLCQKNGLDDVSERHIAMMRPLVIAPAEVQTQLFRRNTLQRVIEGFDVKPRLLEIGLLGRIMAIVEEQRDHAW